MTDITSALEAPFVGSRSKAASPWIASPLYDLAFFICAPLMGIAVLLAAPSGPSLVVLLIGSFVGIPHYLSTFTFYTWSESAGHYRASWLAFIAAPILIAATLAAGMALGAWDVLKFIAYFWNAFHIARQSCGILSIYRHRGAATVAADKHASNAAILAVNGCCAIWSIHLNPRVYPFLLRVSSDVQQLLRFGFLAAAAASLVWLTIRIRARFRDGSGPGFAEIAFLIASLIMFVPYLWIEDWNRAIFGVLVGHFVQYLALVWLVNRRRFEAHPPATAAEQFVARISMRPLWLLAFIAISGGAFIAGPIAFGKLRVPLVWEWIGGALVLLHFYLDGLFWAFRRPHVRATLAPYLRRAA